MQFLGQPIQRAETRVDTLGYLHRTWSAHVDQERKKAAERLGVLGPLFNRSPIRYIRCAALQANHPSWDELSMPDLEVKWHEPREEAASVKIQMS